MGTLAALVFALPLATLAATAPVEPCAPPHAGPAPFGPGEVLHYELDVYGVRLGTLWLETEPAPSLGKGALVLRSRAETDTLAENFRRFKGRASVTVVADLSPRHYSEEAVDDAIRRGMRADFPPQNGALTLHIERDGRVTTALVPAARGVRDYLSVIYWVRALDLAVGKTFCVNAVAARSLWRVTGRVAAKETIDTPAGRFDALHLVLDAARVGEPDTKRTVHAWLSDDAARTPLGAFATVRGKPVRALLVKAEAPRPPPRQRGR